MYRFLLFFLSTVLPALALADNRHCECLWQGSFSKATQKADLIVAGKVVRNRGNAVDIDISQTLLDKKINGQEFNPIIRVWMNSGTLCRPEAADFPIGSEWVMNLNKILEDVPGGFNPNTPHISYGRINDYALSQCGANWLELTEGVVTGNLVKGTRWAYEDKKMSPVQLELISAFIDKKVTAEILEEAAKPQQEDIKALMRATKGYLQQQ